MRLISCCFSELDDKMAPYNKTDGSKNCLYFIRLDFALLSVVDNLELRFVFVNLKLNTLQTTSKWKNSTMVSWSHTTIHHICRNKAPSNYQHRFPIEMVRINYSLGWLPRFSLKASSLLYRTLNVNSFSSSFSQEIWGSVNTLRFFFGMMEVHMEFLMCVFKETPKRETARESVSFESIRWTVTNCFKFVDFLTQYSVENHFNKLIILISTQALFKIESRI